MWDFAQMFFELYQRHAEWSRANFGRDDQSGPCRPLNHMAKEVQEALAAPDDIKEYADLLILWMDATRRAGYTPLDVLRAAVAKMGENERRPWPKFDPTADPCTPTEHIR